jgi:hypothetical protein
VINSKNISRGVGESGNAGQANYVAAKAGLIGLTDLDVNGALYM